ncbi:hypothetical protein V6N13_059573 [Hibiscus sabdariffa]|uniref:Uncharacterized protein n=1 Tax=Hibiscus sabdariffa TaxID=183260 RepID=A0ABR2GD00_9ROSI
MPSIVMKMSSINLTSLILVHILISLCVGHGDTVVSSGETNQITISRKLLPSVASFAAVKEPRKAVEPSLRKAPPSVPNPTQN